jgi:hypothetical protein
MWGWELICDARCVSSVRRYGRIVRPACNNSKL